MGATELLAQLSGECPLLSALAYPVAVLFWCVVAAAPFLLVGILLAGARK